jgi:predicted GIY-YIG superfamily endonuclease
MVRIMLALPKTSTHASKPITRDADIPITKRNGPVTLVYSVGLPSRQEAECREQQLKRWSRAKKQALIDGDLNQLHQLGKRKRPE